MPMHVLALPLVSAKRMPRRKRLFHADLKHVPLCSCELCVNPFF
jgi:hypothetical protein